MAYRVVVTNQMGYAFAELENAVASNVTWEINQPGSAEFTLPATDPKVAYCRVGREIQLWRNGTLIWWGPIVRPKVDTKTASFQCEGLLWYLNRRFFGRADRINWLTNGSFESGNTGWGAAGGLQWGVSTGPPSAIDGTNVMRLDGSLLAANPQSYLSQTYTHRQAHPAGDLMTLSAWAYIPRTGYTGPAFDHLALWAEHRRGGQRVRWGFDPAGDYINEFDKWHRMELAFPGMLDDDVLEVRLHVPRGVIYYDLVQLVYMESLAYVEKDQAEILAGIVAYAQDRPSTYFNSFNHGKSDLFIDTNCPLTGVLHTRDWQFADHGSIGDALQEFTDADNGVDIDITFGQNGAQFTRTFRTYFPRQGSSRPELALELGRNISDFTWAFDGEAAASNVVVLGAGDGPDREEGLASDPNVFGGVTLEEVTAAADGTDVSVLDNLAADELRITSNPELLEVTVHERGGAIIGVLGKGDIVPVRISYASFVVDGDYRVVRLRLDPPTDTMTVTLNREITVEEALARFPRAVDACRAPGGGVWVVGSDGGVGAYGVAAFHGSMGGQPLAAPMVAIVPYSAGGYWLVGADGGIFAFGNAPVRYPYLPMIETEYPRGDRAIVAAEAEGVDNLILIADDGATYVGSTTP